TQTELDLVTYLAANPQKVISKSELQHQVLKRELCPFGRNLDMHISNIRRKLSQAGWPKSTIRTARGVGYQFASVHAQ
ncbi:winged helix-turn-helix domain-containing protein, partial [Vibrio vulnificus]|uniref:winged helix-turn-helix domain-containing protein n=1 Tax=Vibrio vulnificus TaxID=672 RepID=UPI0019D44FED